MRRLHAQQPYLRARPPIAPEQVARRVEERMIELRRVIEGVGARDRGEILVAKLELHRSRVQALFAQSGKQTPPSTLDWVKQVSPAGQPPRPGAFASQLRMQKRTPPELNSTQVPSAPHSPLNVQSAVHIPLVTSSENPVTQAPWVGGNMH